MGQDGWNGPKLIISLPPSVSGIDKTPAVRLCYFPIEQALLRSSKGSGVFQNGFFSPLPAGSNGIFLPIFNEVLVELPEVKLTKVWGPLMTVSPESF